MSNTNNDLTADLLHKINNNEGITIYRRQSGALRVKDIPSEDNPRSKEILNFNGFIEPIKPGEDRDEIIVSDDIIVGDFPHVDDYEIWFLVERGCFVLYTFRVNADDSVDSFYNSRWDIQGLPPWWKYNYQTEDGNVLIAPGKLFGIIGAYADYEGNKLYTSRETLEGWGTLVPFVNVADTCNQIPLVSSTNYSNEELMLMDNEVLLTEDTPVIYYAKKNVFVVKYNFEGTDYYHSRWTCAYNVKTLPSNYYNTWEGEGSEAEALKDVVFNVRGILMRRSYDKSDGSYGNLWSAFNATDVSYYNPLVADEEPLDLILETIFNTLESLKEQSSASSCVVDLGLVDSSTVAEDYAAQSHIAGNRDILLIRYRTQVAGEQGTRESFIVQWISGVNKCSQLLFHNLNVYRRDITGATGVEGGRTNAFAWEQTFAHKIEYDAESNKLSLKDYGNTELSYATLPTTLTLGITEGTAYDGASGQALADDVSEIKTALGIITEELENI